MRSTAAETGFAWFERAPELSEMRACKEKIPANEIEAAKGTIAYRLQQVAER